ncbi:hypothetical protein SAMN03159340_02126 [Sphingomonas sp. NFR15]|nr:hypothetical protein SAMN03159340_02126 [Sphingomonas sp. NFR15]
MKPSSVQSSMSPHSDSQMFLAEDARAGWRRTPFGLWFYAGLGALRIILSGLSIVLIRR